VPGGGPGSLPSADPNLFTEKNPTSTRPRLPEGSPLPKPLSAATVLIQARRAKQLSSSYIESSPSLDQRRDAA
jgi:hypothetical protein